MNGYLELLQNPSISFVVWLVGIIFAVPLGLVFTFALAKRWIFRGTGDFLVKSIEIYLAQQQKRTAADIKLEERLNDLVSEIKNVVKGLSENRRSIDSRMQRIEDSVTEAGQNINKVLYFAKKRKSDWLRTPSETEVFLASRREQGGET